MSTVTVTRTVANATEAYKNSFIASPDGKCEHYATYQDKVEAKRKRNMEMLRSSGLLNASSKFREASSFTSKRKKRSNHSSSPSNGRTTAKTGGRPSRRSPRKTGKPALFSGEKLDELDRRLSSIERKRSIRGSNSIKSAGKAGCRVTEGSTETVRAALKKAENWLEKMHDFLLHVPHGNHKKTVSTENARSVMKQVRLLASGAGVSYHHWPEDVIFWKGRTVDLSADFEELYAAAVEHENLHGRDLGNGWLLRHPIVKMRCFQNYLLESGG